MNIEQLTIRIANDPFFTSNCYLLSASPQSESVVVVDPGDEPERIVAQLGSRRLEAILLTHGHFDHYGAAARLARETGAKIYAHPGDVAWLHEHGEAPGIDVELTDDMELALGDVLLTVLHCPGHSEGSVCFYHEGEGLLISGDVLFCGTCGRTDFPGGSPAKMHNSLARLATLPPETVVLCGHDNHTTIGEEIGRGLSEY